VADSVKLAQLYFDAYEPGAAADTEQDAPNDIALTFEGGYGVLDPSLSQLAWSGDDLVGALLVIERAPWPDTPTAPSSSSSSSIGRLLLSACSSVIVKLCVAHDNAPALALYRDAEFIADSN
jgi:hypothetical protein